MKPKRFLISAFIVGFLNLAAICQTNKTNQETFNDFYSRFTSDSTFQISRVIFPLKGAIYFLKDVGKEDSIPWKREEWLFSDLNIYKLDTTCYKITLTKKVTNVEEIVYRKNSGLFIERHFTLKNGKWYQVYYLVSNF
jgi:hypothetical protein